MHLRRATDDDVPLLSYWDTKPHVQDATGDDDVSDWAEEIAGEPGIYDVFIAELDDGRPIGVIQIIDPCLEPSHYWGDVAPNLRAIDIWIGEESDLGRGHGTTMMQLALARCFARPEITAVIIDPLETNTRAITFYERLGFVSLGLQTFGEDRCLVHEIRRESWDPRRSGQSTGSSFTE